MKKLEYNLNPDVLSKEIDDKENSAHISTISGVDSNIQSVRPLYEDQKHLGGNYQGITYYNWNFVDEFGNQKTQKVPVPGDGLSYVPFLWDWLIKTYNPKTMLDVGSGMGYAGSYFNNKGIKVTALEGLPYNVKNAVIPTIQHDLAKSVFTTDKKFDLTWTCEVAEHIEESCIDTFLSTVTNTKVLAITAAPPGDGGHHHVNCQPIDYWIEKISNYGMKFSFDATMKARYHAASIGPHRESHFFRNGMIFIGE